MINYELGSQSIGGLKVLRKLITKGEVAKLLHMTKSQIRFYEKKGLLTPKIDENGYAMYTFDHMDILEMILLLKELDTPISEIKSILLDEENYNYEEILQRSYNNIEHELTRLKKKQDRLENKLDLYKQSVVNAFSIDDYTSRTVYLFEKEMALETTEKNVYDSTIKYKIDYLDPHIELCSVMRQGQEIVGVMNTHDHEYTHMTDRHILEEGSYFSYVFSYKFEDDVKALESIYDEEAKKRGLKLDDTLIFIDHFGRKFYEKHKVVGTMQKRMIK